MSAPPQVLQERPDPRRELGAGAAAIPRWITLQTPSPSGFQALVRLIAFVLGIAVLVAGALSIVVSRSIQATDPFDPGSSAARAFEVGTGIRFLSVSLSRGERIAVRYQVLDARKALATLEQVGTPILIVERTGARVSTPAEPVSSARLRALVYSTVLRNQGHVVARDSLVTVVMGDARLEHVPVT